MDRRMTYRELLIRFYIAQRNELERIGTQAQKLEAEMYLTRAIKGHKENHVKHAPKLEA